jgi:hypothetical protein
MAVPRYYRVLRGQRTAEARTKYLNYLAGLATPDKTNATPKNRPAKKVLYVKPFGVDLGTDVLLETSALETSFDRLVAAITAARVKAAIPAGSTGIKLRSSKAARVSATSGQTATGTYKKSAATGLWYIDYGGASVSAPFGQGAANEKEAEAFSAIKSALGTAYKNVHLIEERI